MRAKGFHATFEEVNADITARLDTIRKAGRYRELAPASGVSFAHNDYLGLSQHPRLIEAGEWALKTLGCGSRGSRLLGGNSAVFPDTESKIAEFFKAPAALFFSTGYLANLGAIQCLSGLCDVIVSDEKNHASLIDAVRLTRLERKIVPHRQWEGLEISPRTLAISESLFSMDGDIAPEASLNALQKKGAYLMVDEAHAAGVFRGEGQGLFLPQVSDWDHTVVTVTFGKAFGVAGAAVLCSSQMKELLINEARSFIYTTAPSPVVVAMVGESLAVVKEESWRREELWDRSIKVRSLLSETGALHQTQGPWEERSPIIILRLSGLDRAFRFCESMRESGIDIRPIRYPTVPVGEERIRISLNLTVSRENTETMAQEVVKRWKAFSL